MHYAIETVGLTKSFNGIKAVDSIDLKVPEGSIYGFLGPNGAGKTTTLKMLTGLIMPTLGVIKFYDKKVNYGSLKNRSDFGYLPDVPGYYDWMTAVDFLRFSGQLFSIKNKFLNNKIESLLELVGLSDVRKKIGRYSRGMKQRLGIAQALINSPRIVYLDEPVSALDPIGRKEVIDIISKLAGEVTVFFSSHILSDIEKICDRVVIINKGKVQLEDSIRSIKDKYSLQSVEIELSYGNIKELENILRLCEWVENMLFSENDILRVNVKDMHKAQLNIPKIVAHKGMAIKNFNAVESTLEEVFMKVVES